LVVSKIIPDELMPHTEDGRIPDIILNPLGVIGRQNIGQLYEHELNYIASELVRLEADNKKLFSNILYFLKNVAPNQHKFLKENVKTNDDIEEFISDVRLNGLYIHQPPFYGNAEPEDLLHVYSKFNISKTKFVGTSEKLVFGSMYFIQLKHEADSKFSVRSAGQVSLINVPFKSNERHKRGNTLWNDSPIRFGEQEILNMLMLADSPDKAAEVINFIETYSSSSEKRKEMLERLLTTDINLIQNFNTKDELPSNTTSVIRSYFKSIGINMDTHNINDPNEDE
jgi:hypothetical protein